MTWICLVKVSKRLDNLTFGWIRLISVGVVAEMAILGTLKGENHRVSGLGAGTRDRTGDTSLEGWGFTAKLCPLAVEETFYGLGPEGQGDLV